MWNFFLNWTNLNLVTRIYPPTTNRYWTHITLVETSLRRFDSHLTLPEGNCCQPAPWLPLFDVDIALKLRIEGEGCIKGMFFWQMIHSKNTSDQNSTPSTTENYMKMMYCTHRGALFTTVIVNTWCYRYLPFWRSGYFSYELQEIQPSNR